MHFITEDGMFHSEQEPDIPESHPYAFQQPGGGLNFHPSYVDPYVNESMAQHEYDDAYHKSVGNLWELIKFTGTRLVVELSQVATPRAEWEAFGRGRNVDWWQSPQVVSMQAAQHGWLDRYGPYRHKILSQQRIDDYIAGHVPAEVMALEAATAR